MAFLAANVFNEGDLELFSIPFSLSTIFLIVLLIFVIPLFKAYKRDIKRLQDKLSEKASEILKEKKI